jgi:hypothetical protein
MSEDPSGFYDGPNLYPYVGNDPVNYVDPSGQIRYNNKPPVTVPVTGKTLAALQCLENCLKCVTNNPFLNLLVTGGAEQARHTPNSRHYIGEAVDISYRNPVNTHDVFQCGEACGFSAGLDEPKLNHWHLQLVPGGANGKPNGVPYLPMLLPMKPCQGPRYGIM